MPSKPSAGGRADSPRRADAQKTPASGIGRRRATARDDNSAAYQERREEIKQAAAALFKQHGFRGTSISQVAAALDIDRATLYYYVGSKEELFDDVVTEAVRANVDVAESILAREAPAPDKMRDLIVSLMHSYAENYPFLYVFIQENLSHVAGPRSQWSTKMRALNKRYEDIVVAIIQAGLDEGSIKPVAEAWVQAYGVLGMVAWTNRWFNPSRSTVDAEHIGEAYATILLQGMLA
jgi:AcrR family transcriptional regulator